MSACWDWVLLKKGDTAHDHAGSAVGALKGFSVEESLLNRMEAAIFSRPSIVVMDFPEAAEIAVMQERRGNAIEQNRARAAVPFAAAVLGASQAERIAENS